MIAFLKRLAGEFFSGRPELLPMDLDRDWPDVERLLVEEEWPFLRSDVEVSHRQPGATSIVARKDGRFAGFFITHAFGDVGYLDMMVIDRAFRKRGVARPLYFRTLKALKKEGCRSMVVHTTNDSSRLIRLLGFKPGGSYTLLTRDPASPGPSEGAVDLLGPDDAGEIVALDAEVFGRARPEWVASLLHQSSTRFYGLRKDGRLAASACVRARRKDAVCLDMADARTFEDLRPVVDHVLLGGS